MRKNSLFVLDTNMVVSALLFSRSKSKQVFEVAVRTGSLIASNNTFEELTDVLKREKFNKYTSLENRMHFAEDLKQLLVFIEPEINIFVCRDPRDNKFLELAVTAKASCIITGDEDLLVLNPFRGIPIVNAHDLLNIQF